MLQALVRSPDRQQPLLPPESLSPQRTQDAVGRSLSQRLRASQELANVNMKNNSIFKNESLASEFEEDGYIGVPFLNEQEIRRLTDKYQDLHPRDVRAHTIPSYASGYFASTFVNDEDYRRRV